MDELTRPPGNPNFRLLASPPAQRARVRYERRLAEEAARLRDAGFRLDEIRNRFRRRRTWLGRTFTVQSIARLLRTHVGPKAPKETD